MTLSRLIGSSLAIAVMRANSRRFVARLTVLASAVGPSMAGAQRRTVRATQTVNASGGYVIPGLWDMHVHFGGGDTLIAENRALMSLYVAHGVVAVRDAAGDLSESVLAWRDSVARGLLDGPTIFTSGPKIEGINSIWPGDIEVATRAGVDSALNRLQAMRVDFVKLTDNTLDPALFRYALGEIRKRGLQSSAHIPASVSVREAVTLGLGSIEHLSYAVRAGAEREGRATPADVIAAFESPTAMTTYRTMRGRYRDRDALDALLRQTADEVARMPAGGRRPL